MRRDKYYYFPDEFLSFLRDFNDYTEASRDGSKFFIELRDLEYALYMNDQTEQRHYAINHPNPAIATLLNNFFIRRWPRFDGRLYGNTLSLSHLFSWLLKYSALYGDMFYYVEWSVEKIGAAEYTLPVAFDYIHPETMRLLSDGRYVQRYSWYERLRHRQDKVSIREVYFAPAEIFHTQFPLAQTSPAKASMGSLKILARFMRFMLESGEGGAYSKPRKLGVELTRGKAFQNEKRKNDLAKAKIRTNFHLPLAIDGVQLTRYYDFYTVARYKADKCKARNYFVEQFNEQVLKPVAQKNAWQDIPSLCLQGLLSENDIWLCFSAWEKGEISDDVFIEKVARAD